MMAFAAVFFLLICGNNLQTVASAISCYTCDSVYDPAHCHTVEQCHHHEHVCAVEARQEGGHVVYHMGCKPDHECSVAPVIGKRAPHDSPICRTCCSTTRCNTQACVPSNVHQGGRLMCYHCDSVSDPSHCHSLQSCNDPHEICSIEKHQHEHDGTISYKLGCKWNEDCTPVHVGHEHHDPLVCRECCSTNMCHGTHCSAPYTIAPTVHVPLVTHHHVNPLYCFSCNGVTDPEDCTTVLACPDREHFCSMSKHPHLHGHMTYNLGCEHDLICNAVPDLGSDHCRACCNSNLCRPQDCLHPAAATTHAMPPTTTTMLTTHAPPTTTEVPTTKMPTTKMPTTEMPTTTAMPTTEMPTTTAMPTTMAMNTATSIPATDVPAFTTTDATCQDNEDDTFSCKEWDSAASICTDASGPLHMLAMQRCNNFCGFCN